MPPNMSRADVAAAAVRSRAPPSRDARASAPRRPASSRPVTAVASRTTTVSRRSQRGGGACSATGGATRSAQPAWSTTGPEPGGDSRKPGRSSAGACSGPVAGGLDSLRHRVIAAISPTTRTRPTPITAPGTSQGMSIAAQHRRGLAAARALPGGVDLLRVAAEQHGDLVDDHVAHQFGEVLAVVRADLQRPPVDDDPRWHLAAVLAVCGQDAGQRHAAVVEDVGVQDDLVGVGVLDPRHVLDGEFDAGELPLPPALEVLDRVEDEVVELLGPTARQRHLGRHEATTQAAAVPVAAGAVAVAVAAWAGHSSASLRPGRSRRPVSWPTGSSCRMGRPNPPPRVPAADIPRAGLLC